MKTTSFVGYRVFVGHEQRLFVVEDDAFHETRPVGLCDHDDGRSTKLLVRLSTLRLVENDDVSLEKDVAREDSPPFMPI